MPTARRAQPPLATAPERCGLSSPEPSCQRPHLACSATYRLLAEPCLTHPRSLFCHLLLQDPRYMYLSLDEACTHVDAAAFRLVAGIYNRQGTRLLTTAVSPPIR